MEAIKRDRIISTHENYIELHMSYPEAQNIIDLFRLITKKFSNNMTADDINLMTEMADNIEVQMDIPF